MLWARASGSGEDAAATYDLATPGGVRVFAWDSAKNGGTSTALPGEGGKVVLSLSSAPVIIVED